MWVIFDHYGPLEGTGFHRLFSRGLSPSPWLIVDGGAHMVKMADVEKTKSDAADLLYPDDVKKDSHGKMDKANVIRDHHVVSI